MLVSDGAQAKVDDGILELDAWDAAMCVSPETVRQPKGGPEGVKIIVFGAPNTVDRDAGMVLDWWTN